MCFCHCSRGLNPPHRVKSISMASFTPDEMEFIKSRGNVVCLLGSVGCCSWTCHMLSKIELDLNRTQLHYLQFGYGTLFSLIPAFLNAVLCQVGLASGRSLGGDWRCRPHARWTDQLRNETGSVPTNLWRQAGHSTGPWWSDTAARWRWRQRPQCIP